MREFQERNRYKRLLYSRLGVIVVFILILFFSKATFGVYKKQHNSAANALQAKGELRKLEERQAVLDREVMRLQTEEGVEEEIRSKYSVSKSGENLLIIVDEEKEKPMPVQEKQSWWSKFKKLFK